MRSKTLPLAFSLVLSLSGCVDEEVDEDLVIDGAADSPSHHIAGQPTNGADVFQWIDVGDEALIIYKSTIFPPPSRGQILPVDHELTVRYQAFVDRLDAYVREASPELTGNTPRPSVRIYDDGELLNAWASGVPVCIEAPVTFDRAEEVESGREYFSVQLHHSYVEPLEEYSSGGGFFGAPPTELEPCVQAPYSSQLQAFVDWMNSRRGVCRYELGEDGRIHVSGLACEISRRGQEDFVGASSARYYAVIPFVFISTGFLDFIDDEDQIVSVLAHELAHYYKSHATNADFLLTGNIFEGAGEEDYAGGYNYFFSQTLVPEPVRPPRRPDSDLIRDKVLRFVPNQRNPFKGVEGGVLDATLGRFVVNFVYGSDFPRDRDPSCRRAFDVLMDNAFFNLIYDAELTSEEKDAYLELQGAFLECVDLLEVPGDMDLEVVVSAFSTLMGSELPNFEMEGSVGDIVLELDRRMRVFTEQESEFYDFMARERIGYYTAEQEADEMGAELMSAIGMDPIAHALLDLKGGELRESEAPEAFLRENGLTMARCRELFDSDWIDPETGEYVFVPLGPLSNIHHGSCYRAFATTREIVAHGF